MIRVELRAWQVVEIRVLGPVEVYAGGRIGEPGRPQQQIVLASLAAEAGRPVSVEALLDRISGRAPPRRASQLLYTHVARIRRVLSSIHPCDPTAVRVARRSGGYVLEIPPERVDLHRFRRLVGRATVDRSASDRAEVLSDALALWRGEPLAGLSGAWVESVRHAWRQQRLAAILSWAQARLETGEPAAVIDPLLAELAEHPLAEPLQAVLMRALAATGRGAEALEYYAMLRRKLADELGADPGQELRAAHRAILRGEPGAPDVAGRPTAAPAAPDGAAEPPGRVATPAGAGASASRSPAQLPPDVPAFTGREGELEQLDHLCDEQPAVVVAGTAGVGKTALVVRWAHRAVADGRFPDGQLYVNLRGFGPERPLAVGDVLARLLAALGVPQRDIPPETDERAARYRGELAGRRMLIVLDNAADSEQVWPLLPGTTCVTLVTSRDSLAGVVAVHGARRLDLDLLPVADGLVLLRRLIGARVAGDPGAAMMLVRRCARLPLALRIAAELAVSRPACSLSDLVEELADRQQRLVLLDAGGDPRAAVVAVFSWSLQQLPAEAARVFGWLGSHPGEDFDTYAVAALAGTGLGPARRILDRLARAHLVHPTERTRFTMHDLLRAYACQLAVPDDRQRQAAVARLCDYYVATAAAAMDRLHPAEARYRPRVAVPSGPLPPLPDPQAAGHWLDAERPTLVAVAHSAGRGRPDYPVRLSAILHRYLDHGHHVDALVIHSCARRAARAAGDVAGYAQALRGLGTAYLRLGRYQEAADRFRRALVTFQRAGDRFGEIRVATGLGLLEFIQGRYYPAWGWYRQGLDVARAAGDRVGEALALNGLGIVFQRLGRYSAAVHCHEQSLAAARDCGDSAAEAVALDNLGRVQQRLGHHAVAADYHERALVLVRQLGHRVGEAHVLCNLGTSSMHLGLQGTAVDYLERALAVFREVGDKNGQASALNGLGEAAGVAGDPGRALAHFTAAVTLAAGIGETYQHARAHIGLGHAHHRLGDLAQAGHHRQRALELYAGYEGPEADRLRALVSSPTPTLSP